MPTLVSTYFQYLCFYQIQDKGTIHYRQNMAIFEKLGYNMAKLNVIIYIERTYFVLHLGLKQITSRKTFKKVSR